jgi:hypothetical protein
LRVFADSGAVQNFDRLPKDRAFTRHQAFDLGVSLRQLRALDKHGLVRRLFKGVYLVHDVQLTVVRRAQAVALVMPKNAVATDETAAWIHGLDLYPRMSPNELPRLCFFQPGAHERLRNQAVSSGSRQLAVTDVMLVDGVLVTTPLRTAIDLARLRRPDRALGALDGLLRLGVFTMEDMVRELDRYKGYRGIIQARTLVPLATPLSESPAESKLRYEWIQASDLPRPEPQLRVENPFSTYPWRLDLAVAELRYAAEYDGEAFHSSDEQRANDRRRRTFLIDGRGWTIDVLTKQELYAPGAYPAAILRAGIREARLKQGVPEREWRWPDRNAGSAV